MIERTQWSRLEGLAFTARTLVDGLYAGGHASPRHGPGIEFHDYRAYAAGDDPAAIDWKLYGRTDRYYLRRYQRYTDLRAHVVVDVSRSMDYPRGRGTGRSKLDIARELAAAIAFLAVRQRDRVGLALAGQRLTDYLPPGGTWPHLMRLCQSLEAARPSDDGQADLGACLQQVHALARRRGLIVLISDLLDDPAPLFDALSRLRHGRFEVIVFQVLTPPEIDLAQLGASRVKLREMERVGEVATHVPSVQRRYAQLMGEHLSAVQRGCIGRGCDHVLVRTDRPVIEALARYLGRRTGRAG